MSLARDSRAIIFSGGNLGPWALDFIDSTDYLIGADAGAAFLLTHGYKPHLSLGDFDSVDPRVMNRITFESDECLAYDAVDKDWTDTELALREAMNRGYTDILIIGALGTRFDHSLANVHLLRQAADRGCDALLIDERNEIRLCVSQCRLTADERYDYVSLLPLTDQVAGITLHGFRYPLTNATLTIGQSLGISNVLEETEGSISLTEGMLLVIRSRD